MGWAAAELIGARGQDASGLLGGPLVDGVLDDCKVKLHQNQNSLNQ